MFYIWDATRRREVWVDNEFLFKMLDEAKQALSSLVVLERQASSPSPAE
jgi:hypothetical protein